MVPIDGSPDWMLDQARYDALVSYCRRFSGSPAEARDLAHETLLEGWRNAHKLTDAAGLDRWLAAVARNVCLRWRRQATRAASRILDTPELPELTAPDDPTLELEREELGATLERALARLPATTRRVLRLRYLHDASYAEIAVTTGLSVDAVSMRLSRGRAQLRHLLERDEPDPAARAGWQETRLWCPICGRRRQQIRFDTSAAVISFRCTECDDEQTTGSDWPLRNPHFARMFGNLRQPRAIERRATAWVDRYFREALEADTIECTACGAPASVVLTRPAEGRLRSHDLPGMHVRCPSCETVCSSSLASLALSLPEVANFCRQQRRVRTSIGPELEVDGLPAVVVAIESVTTLARFDVVTARDTFAVLGIHQASQHSSNSMCVHKPLPNRHPEGTRPARRGVCDGSLRRAPCQSPTAACLADSQRDLRDRQQADSAGDPLVRP